MQSRIYEKRRLSYNSFDINLYFIMNENNQLFSDEKNDFKDIFKMYFKPLCHLSMHYLANKDESKGAVQDAFIKLWEVRSTLNSNS